jgi:hypothetical protein
MSSFSERGRAHEFEGLKMRKARERLLALRRRSKRQGELEDLRQNDGVLVLVEGRVLLRVPSTEQDDAGGRVPDATSEARRS